MIIEKLTVSRPVNKLQFIVSEGSLPCSQQPATCPILRQINPVHNLSRCFFNIILPHMIAPSKWSLSFVSVPKICMFLSSPRVPHAPPSHSPWLDHRNIILCSVQIMKLITMQFTSSSAPNYRTHSAYILPLMWEGKFHTHIKQYFTVLYNLISIHSESKQKIKDSGPNRSWQFT